MGLIPHQGTKILHALGLSSCVPQLLNPYAQLETSPHTTRKHLAYCSKDLMQPNQSINIFFKKGFLHESLDYDNMCENYLTDSCHMQYFPYLLGQGTVWYKPSLVTRVLKNLLWEELTLDFASLCYSLILRAYQWDYFHSSLIYKMSDPHCYYYYYYYYRTQKDFSDNLSSVASLFCRWGNWDSCVFSHHHGTSQLLYDSSRLGDVEVTNNP